VNDLKLKSLVEKLWPLHRTLVSDGTDEALRIIGEHMPPCSGYVIESYPPGERAWTWHAPERYVVHEAYLETEDGQRIVDFKDNPLHLVSYSLPINTVLTWEDLEPHLHYSAKRVHAIPWEFKYYERSWGFCMSKQQFDGLPRNKRYRVVIRSEFLTGPDQGLRVGFGTIPPERGKRQEAGEILICSHVCHPYQANDDIAGVVTAVEVARRLAEHPLPEGSMSVRFLFCPETIGSICYLSHHEELIPDLKGGIFCEMTGNKNAIALQRTRQDSHLLDRTGRYVLKRRVEHFREGAFREIIGNDEIVINGPGVGIPCISISRWPYDEYHTSDDSPEIVHEDMLVEVADVVEEIVRIYASNYVPRRTFRGPVFLSAYGLWVDWRVNPSLNRAVEKIMLRLEGGHSVFDIAEELGLDYWSVRDHVERFRTKSLVRACPIPDPRSMDGLQCLEIE
jgi:aminopeptidase-like protein